MKDLKLYIINIGLIMMSFIAIQNISTNLSDYKKDTGVLLYAKIKIDTIKGLTSKEIDRALVLTMENNLKWYISKKDYTQYWGIIQDEKNIGKKITFYSKNGIHKRHNPFRLEIENKVIYDSTKDKLLEYLILILTIFVTYYTISKYIKSREN